MLFEPAGYGAPVASTIKNWTCVFDDADVSIVAKYATPPGDAGSPSCIHAANNPVGNPLSGKVISVCPPNVADTTVEYSNVKG